MRRDEAVLRLKLFAERFESLLESRFYRRAVAEGWGVAASFDPE